MTSTEFPGLVPSGSLPHRVRDMHSTTQLSEEKKDELRIIYPGTKNHNILNIYRDLRNKLLRLAEYENFVCLVSSIDDDGETSTLALNLAAVFAFDKSRSSLVIDCDTNWSILDELCATQDELGLIEFVENDQDDISVLIHDSGIDRLRIVPSGRVTETRTEALESLRMREIVMELKKRYPDRYIFVNAPSMKLSSEVQILSNVSDMVIFEVDAGTVTEAQVADAVEMIGSERVAGIVFSDY